MQLNGELGKLLDILTNFLNNREQGVVLNDQTYDLVDTNAEVPQSSIIGLSLFLIYINDLPDDLYVSVKLWQRYSTFFDCERHRCKHK